MRESRFRSINCREVRFGIGFYPTLWLAWMVGMDAIRTVATWRRGERLGVLGDIQGSSVIIFGRL